MTFADALSQMEVTEENKETMDLLKTVLKHQGLEDKLMDGYCSEGLKKKEFERMGICYVQIFNQLEQGEKFWTPLDIVYEVCKHNLAKRAFYEKKAQKYGISFNQITWLMAGRALRALPSYIREYQLKNAIQTAFPKGRFIQDEKLDTQYHCDIKMELDGEEYYIWSFVKSPRSIVQFADKFQNNRTGCIADGNHLLCPFDCVKEKSAAYHGWCFYSKKYLEDIKDSMKQAPIEYQEAQSQITNIDFYKKPTVVHKCQAC